MPTRSQIRKLVEALSASCKHGRMACPTVPRCFHDMLSNLSNDLYSTYAKINHNNTSINNPDITLIMHHIHKYLIKSHHLAINRFMSTLTLCLWWVRVFHIHNGRLLTFSNLARKRSKGSTPGFTSCCSKSIFGAYRNKG